MTFDISAKKTSISKIRHKRIFVGNWEPDFVVNPANQASFF
jgi:hypothetical protein